MKGAVQTIACVSQSWHLAILNVWMKVLFFLPPFTVRVAKKTRSSCFKHLQMVMHQQLVSIQPSYCRGIKKTGQSLRSTANLPCGVREHFTWKKRSSLPAEIHGCILLQSLSPAWQSRQKYIGRPNASLTWKCRT